MYKKSMKKGGRGLRDWGEGVGGGVALMLICFIKAVSEPPGGLLCLRGRRRRLSHLRTCILLNEELAHGETGTSAGCGHIQEVRVRRLGLQAASI